MRLQYFVTKADSGEQVLIAMEPAMTNCTNIMSMIFMQCRFFSHFPAGRSC